MSNGRLFSEFVIIQVTQYVSLTRSHPPLATPSSLRNLRCSGWWGVQLAPHRWRRPVLSDTRTTTDGSRIDRWWLHTSFCGSSSGYFGVYYTFESEQRHNSQSTRDNQYNSRYGSIVFTKLIIHYQWVNGHRKCNNKVYLHTIHWSPESGGFGISLFYFTGSVNSFTSGLLLQCWSVCSSLATTFFFFQQ